jgi:hypothetical protein
LIDGSLRASNRIDLCSMVSSHQGEESEGEIVGLSDVQ